ncbi:uncharacterized protein EDB91DRAFT_499631 [Suillus paluster]|uniref:uncharacterized protein n=1 Tax=Suillus paluster TaxID=48578 RepID=UPI001B8807DA|nr:uncharacterized protein EDB91DRAFT_499631 [Suillus paluster]KAG1736629.1 hypothetical protein EDB91DRAFT_499631 [Suillus paluster]
MNRALPATSRCTAHPWLYLRYQSLSRVYFQNILCLLCLSPDGQAKLGGRVALGDTDNHICYSLQLQSPTIRVARITPASRVPHTDDLTHWKHPLHLLTSKRTIKKLAVNKSSTGDTLPTALTTGSDAAYIVCVGADTTDITNPGHTPTVESTHILILSPCFPQDKELPLPHSLCPSTYPCNHAHELTTVSSCQRTGQR